MPDMTATTMATWLPRVYSMKPTITYRSNTVLVPMMDHTWEPEIVGMGDRVNIPGFTQNNAARNRGAGTGTFGTGATITFDAVTEAQLSLLIDRMYYKAFRQPAELRQQQMPNYVPLLLGGQGNAIALQVDADLAADNSQGIDSASANVVGADNVDITEDNILTCEENLNNNNAPASDRFLVVSPASRTSLLRIEAFRNADYARAMGTVAGDRGAGYIGPILSFQLYMSNNMEAGTSGKKNGAWQREAIAFAEQVSVQTIKDVNVEDGVFDQYVTFQVCGFLKIKDVFLNELDGR